MIMPKRHHLKEAEGLDRVTPPVLLHTLGLQVGECPRHLSFRNDGAGIRTGTESMNASSHLLTTCDGVRLAWAASGHGLPLVRAANWLTHLDHDAGSPVWRHWLRFLRSEEHTSELQSLMRISYAVFCLKKKTTTQY